MLETHEPDEWDPTFLHSRREAWIILCIFALFAAYTLLVSHWLSPGATIHSTERKLLGEPSLSIPEEREVRDSKRASSAGVTTSEDSLQDPPQPPPRAAHSIATVWGIPNWAFFGIVLPWLAAIGVTGWFCFVRMSDDPLAPVADSSVALNQTTNSDSPTHHSKSSTSNTSNREDA
ncbi:MAG: hypothetical protein AAGG44_08980 [Planctomycetota bacterium]